MSEPEQQPKQERKTPPVIRSDAGGLGILFAIAILVAGIFSMSQNSISSTISSSFAAIVDVLNKQAH